MVRRDEGRVEVLAVVYDPCDPLAGDGQNSCTAKEIDKRDHDNGGNHSLPPRGGPAPLGGDGRHCNSWERGCTTGLVRLETEGTALQEGCPGITFEQRPAEDGPDKIEGSGGCHYPRAALVLPGDFSQEL